MQGGSTELAQVASRRHDIGIKILNVRRGFRPSWPSLDPWAVSGQPNPRPARKAEAEANSPPSPSLSG